MAETWVIFMGCVEGSRNEPSHEKSHDSVEDCGAQFTLRVRR